MSGKNCSTNSSKNGLNPDIPLGTKLNIIASGTKNTQVTIKVLVDGHTFPVIKEGQEVTQFDVRLDENGRAVTAVELRPANDDNYKQLIDDYSPKPGQGEKRSKLTLMGETYQSGSMSSLKNDDMNTIGLNLFQLYIKSAYVVNPKTGKVHAQLKALQQGDDIVFIDAQTGEPVAKTRLDNLVNGIGNINNGFGGLATGMEKTGGTFAYKNSKGLYLKHYESGWTGNQYVKTYSMSRWAGRINNGTLWISVVVGAYQIDSAYQTDTSELKKRGIKDPSPIERIGQHTEQQVGSTALGFAGGLLVGLLFLPEEAGFLVTVGIFLLVGGIVGYISSELGSETIEEIQELKGGTLINNYPIHNHDEE